ncbi:MAG TPA: hypothetical protein VGL81_05150 [Polyangiaceae bacterium]|jgi:hypothetical protein
MSKIAKPDRSDRNRTMIAGIQKRLSTTPTITLNGQPFTTAALITFFQDEIDTAGATLLAEGAFHKAVAAEKAAVAAGEPVFRALRAFLLNLFEGQPDVLADFGITVVARQVPSAATKAAAALKAKATRAARGTGGKRQKAKITGAAPATPATTPPAAKPA